MCLLSTKRVDKNELWEIWQLLKTSLFTRYQFVHELGLVCVEIGRITSPMVSSWDIEKNLYDIF
jgi:hypothetical protein